MSFLGKFGAKNQNCQFKQKFVTRSNSKMQDSLVITSQFLTGNTFMGKFGPENQNCQFKLKIGTKTNLYM